MVGIVGTQPAGVSAGIDPTLAQAGRKGWRAAARCGVDPEREGHLGVASETWCQVFRSLRLQSRSGVANSEAPDSAATESIQVFPNPSDEKFCFGRAGPSLKWTPLTAAGDPRCKGSSSPATRTP